MSASPFPGMDPFLENPKHWPDFHNTLITVIRSMLIAEVTPAYVVRTEDRVYVEGSAGSSLSPFVPDVLVTLPQRERVAVQVGSTIIDEPIRFALPEYEVRDHYLVVRDGESDQVVTVIEVLSPTNKRTHSRGQQELARKRDELIDAGAHWLEIDLLRAGARSPLLMSRGEYCAVLRRADASILEVWFAGLRDPLPTVAVPLLPPDPDVPLSLQSALNEVYRLSRYDRSVNYTAPIPDPPLSPEDEAWVRERIRRVKGEE